jgi:hypothetical protein
MDHQDITQKLNRALLTDEEMHSDWTQFVDTLPPWHIEHEHAM